MSDYSVTTAFKQSEDQRQRLEAKAESELLTVSAVLRRLVRDYVQPQEPEHRP
jgi:hypothetical protein